MAQELSPLPKVTLSRCPADFGSYKRHIDEGRYLAKYKALKEKVSTLEADNLNTQGDILKSKRQIQKLRLERAYALSLVIRGNSLTVCTCSLLYERLHASRNAETQSTSQEATQTSQLGQDMSLAETQGQQQAPGGGKADTVPPRTSVSLLLNPDDGLAQAPAEQSGLLKTSYFLHL